MVPIQRPPGSPSWAFLGLIRFLLASVVFVEHLIGWGHPTAWVNGIDRLGGKAAVMGFFLISGFSMAHSYRGDRSAFYARRVVRIYPLYAASILLCYALQLTVRFPIETYAWVTTASSTARFGANLLFLQGLFSRTIRCNVALWSLAIEAWFYVATPWFAGRSRAQLLALTGLSLVLYRIASVNTLALLWGEGAVLYLWPWLIGFMVARDGLRAPVIVLGIVGMAIIETVESAPLSGLTYGVVLAAVLGAGRIRLACGPARVAAYLGDLSYPLYLFHIPLLTILYCGLDFREAGAMVPVVLGAVAVLELCVDRLPKERLWRPAVGALFGLASRPGAGRTTPAR